MMFSCEISEIFRTAILKKTRGQLVLYFLFCLSSLVNLLSYIIIYRYQAGIYLLKVNIRNARTSCEICLMLSIKRLAIGVVLVSLLLTLNIFHTLFYRFRC